ncbi:hypothetical protein C8J57DRAFT_1214434 [Mycena rebaudengoi]|nr:hypothetical protein C8J57DRAFT_1214434 [Mycena rebaudengoi]
MSGVPNRSPATSPGASPVAATAHGIANDKRTPTIRKRHSASVLSVPAEPAPPSGPPASTTQSCPLSPKPKKVKRPSTATGTREEVTPWEFFPVNASTWALNMLTLDKSTKQASDTATGKREDVLPWELFPAPQIEPSPVINGSSTPPSRSPRPSTSSSSMIFQDIALLRRRKSTGTKPRAYSNATPPVASGPPNPPRRHPESCTKPPPRPAVRPPLPKASSGPIPTLSSNPPPTPPPPVRAQALSPHSIDPKFSTADRTILQELKRNIHARASQFVIKGGLIEGGRGATSVSMTRLGARHHAYDREEVPYPRSYASEVLDLDVWETMNCQKICDSLTWHVFPTPPTKVLDIGCGALRCFLDRTGTWILNCGMAWRNCHFVGMQANRYDAIGMDVVPLHPDLGASELASRITWVQANFLEGLPFPNDEFDFVSPTRASQLIEEDLFFPGKKPDDDIDSDPEPPISEPRYGERESLTPERPDDLDHDDDESVITGSGGSRISYDGSAPTPNTSIGIPVTPPRSASPLPMLGSLMKEETIAEEDDPFVYHTACQVPAAALVPAAQLHTRSFKFCCFTGRPSSSAPNHQSAAVAPPLVNGMGKPTFSPFLLRTLPKAPQNPRDHTLLEGIYNEMNASRFINLSPLSLLANLVGLHFKDVRTHPPLQLSFPPPAAHPCPEESASEEDSDSDDAKNAIIPSPRRRSLMSAAATSPTQSAFSEDSAVSEEHRFLHTKNLMKRESRYVSLDDARMSAFSPSTRATFPALSPGPTALGPDVESPVASGSTSRGDQPLVPLKQPTRAVPSAQRNRLPNETLNIDRCWHVPESMWEWVTSFQTQDTDRQNARAFELAGHRIHPEFQDLLAARSGRGGVQERCSRPDEGGFRWPCRTCGTYMGIGATLRDHFSWPCMPLAPSQDRKAFKAACERWEQWQDQQLRKRRSPYERHQPRSSTNSMPDTSYGCSRALLFAITTQLCIVQDATRSTTQPLYPRVRRLETVNGRTPFNAILSALMVYYHFGGRDRRRLVHIDRSPKRVDGGIY